MNNGEHLTKIWISFLDHYLRPIFDVPDATGSSKISGFPNGFSHSRSTLSDLFFKYLITTNCAIVTEILTNLHVLGVSGPTWGIDYVICGCASLFAKSSKNVNYSFKCA